MFQRLRPVLILLALALAALPARAFETAATAAWVYDMTTGTVLMDKNADQPVPAIAANDCRLLTETGTRGPVGKRNLADLPPADAYAAVWRTDEKGCPDPVLFRRR